LSAHSINGSGLLNATIAASELPVKVAIKGVSDVTICFVMTVSFLAKFVKSPYAKTVFTNAMVVIRKCALNVMVFVSNAIKKHNAMIA